MSNFPRPSSGLLMAVGAYMAWGLLTPIGKILLEDWPPLGMNAVRMTLATAILVPLMPKEAWKTGFEYMARPKLLLVLVIGGGIDFTLFIYALSYVDATYATLGFYTAPIWTAVLAWWRLKEPIGRTFIPTIVVLLLGGYLALAGSAPIPDVHVGGMVLAVLTGVGWAVYTVALRAVAPNLELRPLVIAGFVSATVYFWIITFIVEGMPSLDVPRSSWGWLLLHAAIPSTLALILFNASLQRIGANAANMLVGIELAATAMFAALLLGDRFEPLQLLGLAAVLVAVTAYLYQSGKTAQSGG